MRTGAASPGVMMPTPSLPSEAICVRLSGLAFRRAGGGRERGEMPAYENNGKPTDTGGEEEGETESF